MAKRTPWQIAAETEQQERACRHARWQERQQGAEKLQELLAMLESIEGRYDATFGLTTEPTAIEAFRDTVALDRQPTGGLAGR